MPALTKNRPAPPANIPAYPQKWPNKNKANPILKDKLGYNISFHLELITEVEQKLTRLIDILQDGTYIGVSRFAVEKILLSRDSYKAIIEKGVKLSNHLYLSFKTPVQFKSKQSSKPFVFPLPEYIFSSLGRIWNTFSEIKVDLDELISWVRTHVYVRAYTLKTREINIGKTALQVGFRGNLLLIIDEGDFCEWVKALLLFSEYSNVGTKRSIGMGVVRVREKENLSKNATKSLV